MKKEELYETFSDISEAHVKEARQTRAKKSVWVKWVAAAACLCLIIGGIWSLRPQQDSGHTGASGGTLPGADKIYPTVMVGDVCYEWRRGRAIYKSLPDGCEYYGEITHVSGEWPEHDGEFVSTFSASGQIYTVQGNTDTVYLCLTTSWMDGTFVAFDICRE